MLRSSAGQEFQSGRVAVGQRVDREIAILQIRQPMLDERENMTDLQLPVDRGVITDVRTSQLEESRRRTQSRPPFGVLLQMNERAGELDQTLVEIPVGPVAILQPQFLQHVV